MSTIKNHGQVLLQSGTGNDLFLDMNGSDRSGQTMAGGAGNDVYQVDSGEDFVIENAGGGIDTVEIVTTTYWDEYAYWDSQDYWDPYYYFNGEYWEGAYVGGYDGAWVTEGLQDGYTLGANVENLTVDGENTGYWWWDSFAFAGNAEANVIDISNTWGDGGELYGLAGNDTLIGSDGSDWLEGGAGSDRMVGGRGDDRYYVQDVGDTVIEVTDNTATVSISEEQGEDTVYSDITYTAPTGVENVHLWGTAGEDYSGSTSAINATGNALDNDLFGNAGNNLLSGLAGSDALFGEDGNDILSGGAGEDFLVGGYGNDNLTGGDDGDLLDGGWGNDILAGENGNDEINGGWGNDSLDGGAGNDFLADTYGYYGEDGSSNASNDTLKGGVGNDVLVSGRGADLLEGGDGNDELREIGEDGATNILRGGNGDDLLRVFDNYGANTLEGGAGNDVLIVGLSGEDGPPHLDSQIMIGEDNFSRFVLDGGAGDDAYFILGHESAEELKVVDSGGNDTIYLVNGEDSLREILGSDFVDNEDSAGTVHPALDMDFFTMAAGIENLYADGLNDGEDGNGANSMYLVGNVSDNLIVGTDDRDVLIGGAGNDTLEGGASADDLVGGAGNDLYILGDIFGSSANDTVVEAANEGTDTVWAYQSYKLENNVEHLRLFGWENLKGTGNALDNSLTGNGGDNVLSGGIGNDVLDGGAGSDALYGGTGVDRLDGGSGSDTMNGGGGNDTYIVDNLGDKVFEFSDLQSGATGPNIDNVFSSVSFTLGANIENLTLTGSAPGSADIDGRGNDGDNVIVGNVGNNSLYDGSVFWTSPEVTAIAGGGKDTLIGGAGNDHYYVNWDSSGIDVVNDSAGTNDWVGLHVGADFDNRDVLVLGAGNLLGIEHLTIYGDYDGVGAGPANPDASGFTITGSGVDNEIHGSNVGDTIGGGGGNDDLYGNAGNDLLKGDAGDDHLYGGDGNNTLEGGAGNDHLYSQSGGSDHLAGGDGNDYYHVDNSYLGNETIVESSLAAGGSNDVIEAWGQDIDLTNTNVEGAVVMGYGTYLTGTSITATGTSANNFFQVLDVNSSGGSGVVDDDITLVGGAGSDFYLVEKDGDDENIFIVEASADSGVDTVRSFVNFSLDEGVENLVLAASYSSSGSFNFGAWMGDGNAGNNTITGNAGSDNIWWDGSVFYEGNDLTGHGGTDNLIGDKGNDWLDGDDSDNPGLIFADRMEGRKGDDEYVVNKVGTTGDVVVELVNEGYDKVYVDNRDTALTYTLAGNVEAGELMDGSQAWGGIGTKGGTLVGNQLDNSLYAFSGSNRLDGAAGNDYINGGEGSDSLIGGTGNDDLHGNNGNDMLDGGAGNDRLYGGYGSDNLIGGDGNDRYYVDDSGDVVTETNAAAAGGIDWVYTDELEGYSLGANVENLFMYNDGYGVEAVGNNLNNFIVIDYESDDSALYGGDGNDRLESASGSDWLDGGLGNDYMVGGNGWDTYYVDSTGDFAMEEGDEGGEDTVLATGTSFNLATNGWNIENIYFEGDAVGVTQIVGIGNELDNYMDASAVSADKVYLQGGGGDDELRGGALADTLFGGAGEDYLDGGASGDTMAGGMGDDWYMVNTGSDEVLELPGEGEFDTIESSVDYVNAFGVETLILQSNSGALNATGRDTQDETLIGNGNDNVLIGNGGDDWLRGGVGADTLTGGGDFVEDLDDFDTFVLTDHSGGIDTITDFVDGDDVIAVSDSLFGYYGFEQQLYTSDFTSYDGTVPSWSNGANIGYNSADGSLWFSVIGDGSDLVQFGVVDGNLTTINEADFIVI